MGILVRGSGQRYSRMVRPPSTDRIWPVIQLDSADRRKTIQRSGLVDRTAYAEVPPRVEYSLTTLGASVLSAIQHLAAWSSEHHTEIRRHQDAYGMSATRECVTGARHHAPSTPCRCRLIAVTTPETDASRAAADDRDDGLLGHGLARVSRWGSCPCRGRSAAQACRSCRCRASR